MPESLQTPDGQPVSLPEVDKAESKFFGAMAAPSAEEPAHPAPPRIDHEAPYGRKTDGTPRKRPAGPGRPKADAPRVTSSPPASKSAESAADAASRRTEGVTGLMQLVGGGFAVAYSTTRNTAFLADALAVNDHAPAISAACAEVAANDARFAALIDKLTAAGPYAALIGAVVPLVAQLARNHGVTAAQAMGAVDPDELIATLDQQAA